MLQIRVLCTGRLKEKFFAEACGEYAKRLRRYCSLEITELSETGDRQKDARAMAERLRPGEFVIALCIEGTLLSSEKFADMLAETALRGASRLCFLIGGSDGLSGELKQRADARLSLSPMTFPHHLARVLLLEQLYRVFQIREGGPYHK